MSFPGLDFGLGLLSFLGGQRRNKAQLASAREQMAFQREMSNTSFQRQRRDLELAGYNPILAVKHGGASTPAGAQAQMADTVTPGVSSALAARRNKAEVESLEASAAVQKVDARKRFEEIKNVIEERQVIKRKAENLMYSSAKMNAEVNSIQEQAVWLQQQVSSSKEAMKAFPHLRKKIMAETSKILTELRSLRVKAEIDETDLSRWAEQAKRLTGLLHDVKPNIKMNKFNSKWLKMSPGGKPQ